MRRYHESMSAVSPLQTWQPALRSRWQAVVRNLNTSALLLSMMLSPSSYRGAGRAAVARHLYLGTAPMLPWFTLFVAMASLVLIRIVVVTAASYGLSQYALETVIRVLVLELIPLTSALFVAVNVTLPGGVVLSRQVARREPETGASALVLEAMPRALAGMFAVLTLAVVSCVVALVLAYLVVHGPTHQAFDSYTRKVGQVFNPAVTLIFVLKTLFFSLAVSLIPTVSGMNREPASSRRSDLPEVQGLMRMFLLILLIEVASLVGNYY
jgi:phospholipid/cholesterol/gamma-HCH transport system permease protein